MKNFRRTRRQIHLTSSCLLMLMLAGCASSPDPVYFSLAASHGVDATGSRPPETFIEVLPVHVPEKLNRREIVVTEDATRLRVSDQRRWAATFPDEMRDAVSAGLQSRLPVLDLYQQPAAGQTARTRVALDVIRFDIQPAQVDAQFGWRLESVDSTGRPACGAASTVAGSLFVARPVDGDGMAKGVAASQAAVQDLVNRLVELLRTRCDSVTRVNPVL